MKQFFITAILLLGTLGLYAQQQNDITLVVNGQGSTKEEATANALRSAIEQSYGVFVSANTQILNDEIVKDEIATVASGNVKEYKELSCITMPDGSLSVTLSVTVSIGNLISYAKSHGSSAEFAGQTFAMNMKMRKLNTENELKALIHLKNQVAMMARNIYDYSIEVVGEPRLLDNGAYEVSTLVIAKGNENYERLMNLINSTLQSLSLSQSEVDAWHRNNMKTTARIWGYYNIGTTSDEVKASLFSDEDKKLDYLFKEHKYFFRNDEFTIDLIFFDITRFLIMASLSWSININNDVGACYFLDVSTIRINTNYKSEPSVRYYNEFREIGKLISNNKNSSYNTALLNRLSSYGSSYTWCSQTFYFSVIFQLSEEELFNTTGFEVKYDSQIYDIYSKRSLTEIYLNLPTKHHDFSQLARYFVKDENLLKEFNNRINRIRNSEYTSDGWDDFYSNSYRNIYNIPPFVYTIYATLDLYGKISVNYRVYDDLYYKYTKTIDEIVLDQSFYESMNDESSGQEFTDQTSGDSRADDEVVSQQMVNALDSSQASEKSTADSEVNSLQAVPLQLVEERPLFMGGDFNTFTIWVSQNLVHPNVAKGIEGSVMLLFTIDVDGTIKDVKVRGWGDDYDIKWKPDDPEAKIPEEVEALYAEAVRVVSMSPKWTPGKIDGRPVAVTCGFFVPFRGK